ncbi:MAG: (d)CMP kinase [Thermodesulfobacteriota bacterium]|nr:(d)CMP kinase [Thermodesulfobacteriota bacterium]
MDGIITIDGPTGSGKSTVSRSLARQLNYQYLDTGAMYRAVGIALLKANVKLQDIKEIEKICLGIDIKFVRGDEPTKILLNGMDITKEIRDPDIDLFASKVSALDIVRKAMVKLQRKEGAKGRLVAEGRDMGTVVFPEAKHKFYIDALLEERVTRRFSERRKRGESVLRENVKEDLIKRDYQDMNRNLSPLKPAKDAKMIDTTGLDVNGVVKKIMEEIKKN